MIVRELLTRIGFNLDQNGINRAEAATNRLRDRANDTANAFRNVFAGLVGIASIRSLINTADNVQSIESRLGMLPQAIDGASAAFDHVVERANNARQSLDAYASFYIKAGNATQDFVKDQETLTKIVDGVSFGLAASGSTAVAQSQAFFQLGQAIGSPIVQMEEMNTLIDVAPDLFRALGDAIPGANKNLKAFIGTGKVTGQMLAEGLIKVLPMFEEKMKRMPLTVGQATVMVSNKFSSMIARMNRESLLVTKIATTILEVFGKIEKGVDFVIDKFGGWENAIRFVGIAISAALGAKAIAIIVALNGTLAPILIKWALIAAAILLVAIIIEDLYMWVSGEGKSLTEDLIGPWSAWSAYVLGAFAMIKDAVVGLGKYVGALAAMLVGVFTMDWNLIKEGYKGQVEILSNALQPAVATYSPGAWSMGTSSAMGNMKPSVNNQTTVNVTVPPGTTAEQAKFIERSADMAYSDLANKQLSRDMGAYAQ